MAVSILLAGSAEAALTEVHRILNAAGHSVAGPYLRGFEAVSAWRAGGFGLAVLEHCQVGLEAARLLSGERDVPLLFLVPNEIDPALDAAARALRPLGYVHAPWEGPRVRSGVKLALHKQTFGLRRRDGEVWYAATIPGAGEAVLATDAAGNVTFLNVIAEAVLGVSRADANGRTLANLLSLAQDAGGHGFSIAAMRRPSGTLRAITDLALREKTVAKEEVRFRAATTEKRLERRLEQAERMAAVGRMAAGMAQEMNHPLTYVTANLGFIDEALTDLERVGHELRQTSAAADGILSPLRELAEAVDEAKKGTDRVRRVVGDLLRFARSEGTARSILDVPEVLDAAVALLDLGHRGHAPVTRRYGTTPFVEANEGQLVQAILNVLVNAADACEKTPGATIELVTFTDEGGRAVIVVHDTGKGIDPSIQSRVVEPFFSHGKGDGRLGLGLSMTQAMLSQVAGELRISSTEGSGTRVILALVPAHRTEELEKKALLAPDIRRARILIVDDEVAIARLVEKVLRQQHDVVVETDPRSALARLARGEVFDAFFCDLMMPHLTGMDVYAHLVATNPSQARRMVFMTGGAFNPESRSFLDQVDIVSISKPFSAETLRRVARDYAK